MNKHWEILRVSAVTVVMFGFSACGGSAESGNSFSLPSGNVDKGSVIFNELQCTACHTIHGRNNNLFQRSIDIRLGGQDKTYSYEYLLTSIINPSHKLADGYERDKVSRNGESKMRKYNDFITVTELVDLVEFLKSVLEVRQPVTTAYPNFHLPEVRNPGGQENY